MSQVAENVIPGLEVVEHFGDVQQILRELSQSAPLPVVRARSDRRIKLLTLGARVARELSEIPEDSIYRQLQEARKLIGFALARPDNCGLTGSKFYRETVSFAQDALKAAGF